MEGTDDNVKRKIEHKVNITRKIFFISAPF